jgi:hypothetical protein
MNGDIPSKEFENIGKAFNSMIRELEGDPERFGFYGASPYVSSNQSVDGVVSIQYWRSQEDLNAYAKSGLQKHFPNMIWTAESMKASAQIGIWHESFTVRAGEYEGIYINCPQLLLGKVGKLVRATGKYRSAKGRLGLSDGSDLDHVSLSEIY